MNEYLFPNFADRNGFKIEMKAYFGVVVDDDS
jgi:hypothetical protein